jgi:hypothetical protein
MGVPPEVRAVERPTNTVVEDSGRDTPLRYAVRERAFIEYKPGCNPRPHNGKVIGHIINLQFVPVVPKMKTEPDMLSYGAVTLINHILKDIYNELLAVFPVTIVFAIMSLAILKVAKPKISSKRMNSFYKRTFVSKYYPDASLSKNSISKLYNDIGVDSDKRKQFFELRVESLKDEHNVVIDTTLKENNSYVNDLSKYSYKSRVKCEKDISIIFAYNANLKEPICSKVNPGNINDASALESFIIDNHITKGTIIVDKGFTVTVVRQIKEKFPDLGIVMPIRNNDRRIEKYDMLSFENVLIGVEDNVLYKKAKISDDCYLYSFRDEEIAKTQFDLYIKKSKKNKIFDKEKFEKKNKFFGVVIFESDKDQEALDVYNTYRDRWFIETSFKMYKSGAGLENTNVHGDFSVIGEEFVNFIATTATCRIVRMAEEKGLLEDQTYSEMMEDLNEAWRMVDSPEPPSSADMAWVHTTKDALKTLEAFGLSTPEPAPAPKRSVGRPRKEPEGEPAPKRPVGRPRKEPEAEPKPKRPVGRPRKEPADAEPMRSADQDTQ